MRSRAWSCQHSTGWTLSRHSLGDEMQCNPASVLLTVLSMLHRWLRKSQLSLVLLGKCESKRGKHKNWKKLVGGTIFLRNPSFLNLKLVHRSLGKWLSRPNEQQEQNWQSWKINLLNLADQVSARNSTTYTTYQEKLVRKKETWAFQLETQHGPVLREMDWASVSVSAATGLYN